MSEEQPRLFEVNDNDAYYDMSRPFESSGKANEAVNNFLEAVYELRRKHGIQDVSLIIRGSIVESGPFMAGGHFGDEMQAEAMAAWYLGHRQEIRQDIIRQSLDRGLGSAVRKPKNRP